jgi:hypothetical protein
MWKKSVILSRVTHGGSVGVVPVQLITDDVLARVIRLLPPADMDQ